MTTARLAVLGLLAAASLYGVPAEGAEPAPAAFALIIGSNRSVDEQLPPLKYADDDAADYFDFFRALGGRVYLLSRLDSDTARLHPQAAAEAFEPRKALLDRTTALMANDIAQAHGRHVETVVYLVYAGHGNVIDNVGYITLEDERLTGSDLNALVRRLGADSVHVIVDACASYYLAFPRGPGGDRRALGSFHTTLSLASDARVGLLLSTSSARESHEWEGFQAGVFSHEVRSGLYGAADADGDGRITYREIAAFVARANASIPNEKFRPDVLAKPPRGSDTLVDLQRALDRHIEVDGAHAAHYWLEDSQGVRLLDFHNSPRQRVRLLRPAGTGLIYARRVEDGAEFAIPNGPGAVALADLPSTVPVISPRGAEHAAYQSTFALPFDAAVVGSYRRNVPEDGVTITEPPPAVDEPTDIRKTIGWAAAGAGVVALGAGALLSTTAVQTAHATSPMESQAAASDRNRRIGAINVAAGATYIGGSAALAAGVVLALWPRAPVQGAVLPNMGYLGYFSSF